MQMYRRLDRAWARCEAALTVGVLIAMVLIAGFAVGIRNLTRFELGWANALLTELAWTDSFLRKATVLLAFLGASQATYYRKHISIDVITRSLPLRPRYLLHGVSSAIAGLIALALAASLGAAVELELSERPMEYEVLDELRPIHVCDAAPEQLDKLHGLEIPSWFCRVRVLLGGVGLQPESPGAAFLLVVPLLFFIMACRFIGIAASSGHAVYRGEEALRELESEELARLAAVHAALRGEA